MHALSIDHSLNLVIAVQRVSMNDLLHRIGYILLGKILKTVICDIYAAIFIYIFHQYAKVLFLPVYPFLRVLDPKKCQNQPSDDFHSLSAIVWHPGFLNAAKDIRSISNIQRENVRGINWVSYKVNRQHLITTRLR